MPDQISPREFHEAEGSEDWRVVAEGAVAFFRTESLGASAQLVAAIAAIEGLEEHPPAIDVRREGVTVRLIDASVDYIGMTTRELDRARLISSAARDAGVTADPSAIQTVTIIPGSPDRQSIMPFWRAALGYVARPDSPDEDLIDAHDRGPAFWFEEMDEPRADGGGAIHIAIWVPPEAAEARVAAALAAGGHMVRDEYAPSWWTLADAAGNEADIATTMGRD
jgi:4a-hydroxytetrahydrobiopterin dehydratase